MLINAEREIQQEISEYEVKDFVFSFEFFCHHAIEKQKVLQMIFINFYDLFCMFSIVNEIATSSFLGFKSFISIPMCSKKLFLKKLKNSQSESVYLFYLDFFRLKT